MIERGAAPAPAKTNQIYLQALLQATVRWDLQMPGLLLRGNIFRSRG